MNNHHAYIYYDPLKNNEPFYVGHGSGTRYKNHFSVKKIRTSFYARFKSIIDNGEEPLIGVYSVDDKELAQLVEEELIALIGRADLGLGPLTNQSNGGWRNSGIIRPPKTKEQKENLSQKMMGKNKGRASPYKGVRRGPRSEEEKAASRAKKAAKLNLAAS